jgi:hypothetical protein
MVSSDLEPLASAQKPRCWRGTAARPPAVRLGRPGEESQTGRGVPILSVINFHSGRDARSAALPKRWPGTSPKSKLIRPAILQVVLTGGMSW